MFCSTVIPTIGRSSLDKAVNSVLDQAGPFSFEIIVVNDSGEPLAEATWQSAERVRILQTNREERSAARNAGAKEARGEYLHFLDDDDWLAPGALHAFHQLAQEQPAAVWLYGHTQLVDRDQRPLMTLKHGLNGSQGLIVVMSGEVIPLQSSLIKKEAFQAIGGFHVWMSGPENHDLERRLLIKGALAELDKTVSYVARGEAGSSTDLNLIKSQSRKGREHVLDLPEAYPLLLRSAGTASYWRGRLVYIYLTSGLWNIQHARYRTAGRRVFRGLLALLSAGRHWVQPSFWRALLRPFQSLTYLRAETESGLKV